MFFVEKNPIHTPNVIRTPSLLIYEFSSLAPKQIEKGKTEIQ